MEPYDNSKLGRSVGAWAVANRRALAERYRQLHGGLKPPSGDGLLDFARAQHFCAWVVLELERERSEQRSVKSEGMDLDV